MSTRSRSLKKAQSIQQHALGFDVVLPVSTSSLKSTPVIQVTSSCGSENLHASDMFGAAKVWFHVCLLVAWWNLPLESHCFWGSCLQLLIATGKPSDVSTQLYPTAGHCLINLLLFLFLHLLPRFGNCFNRSSLQNSLLKKLSSSIPPIIAWHWASWCFRRVANNAAALFPCICWLRIVFAAFVLVCHLLICSLI